MTHQIVPANDSLLAEIETWLDAEEAAHDIAYEAWKDGGYDGERPVRGFRCNWDTAKRWWREGHQPISVLVVESEAVAFLVGDQILEVRPDQRGNGYGHILADHMVKSAYEDGPSLVSIDIAPSSAIPFWERMGFHPVPERESYNGLFAYRLLPRAYQLGTGERVTYSVEFFSPEGRYRDEPEPFSRFSGEGERLPDGSIQLPMRAYCFRPEDDQHVDYFVKIVADGSPLHFDKTKREESRRFGVTRDKGYTYFIDRIAAPVEQKAD
jgi:GNAT superfamily N-acetyltransferase